MNYFRQKTIFAPARAMPRAAPPPTQTNKKWTPSPTDRDTDSQRETGREEVERRKAHSKVGVNEWVEGRLHLKAPPLVVRLAAFHQIGRSGAAVRRDGLQGRPMAGG